MYLTQFTLETLRAKVETGGSFQIIITPIYPQLFESVELEADRLYYLLKSHGYSVLVDDRNQKPANMFKVASFLDIPHRLTLSRRSLDAGVYEYYGNETQERCKVPTTEVVDFLKKRLTNKS